MKDSNDKDSKSLQEGVVENQTIVEEKVVKVTGEVHIRKYIKGRLLGKGGFAKCFELTCMETKKIYAGKVVTKASLVKSRAKQKLISEIKIHKALRNTNVVGFEHYFEDSENVYILLEMCHSQSMNELLKRRKTLTELETQCYVMQLIKALKYLHSHRIIHRDLKLGNLFLTDKMEVKVGDFGLASKLEFEGERKRTVCGTPNYIAPEILDGKSGHSYEVDIWSLGVIIYTLIIGKPPFETQDVKTTYKRIKMNSYTFPERAVISDAAKSLITDILNLDPLKRPNLDKILACDFFQLGTSIPKLLPTSTLACPPSLSYIRQYMPDAGSNGIVQKPLTNQRVVDRDKEKENITAPKTNITDRNKNQQYFTTSSNKLDDLQNNINRPLTTNYNSTKNPNTTKDVGKNLYGTSTNIFNSEKSSAGTGTLSNNFNSTSGSTVEVWVKKWVDYSSKYGLGYFLNNGFIGVFFNDSSKIIFDTRTNNFNYIERRLQDKQEIVSSYSISDYPKDLQKKVTLLQHFRNYLEGDGTTRNDVNLPNLGNSGGDNFVSNIKPSDDLNGDDPNNKKVLNFVYVKKWMKTRHAIMFRLSNKIVQVCFQDHTEIILSSESRVVTYVNKKAERLVYQLSNALESNNVEMTKRLKYTKDILTHMLNTNAGTSGGSGASNRNKDNLNQVDPTD